MNLMMTLILGLNLAAHAETEKASINFHLTCYEESDECIEIEFHQKEVEKDSTYFSHPTTIRVYSDPEMTVDPGQLESAYLRTDQFGIERLALNFQDSTAQRFAKLTEENVGKQLVIVIEGKALTSPTINEAIRGGRVEINSGVVPAAQLVDQVPWLKELIEGTKASEEGWSLFSVLLFIAVGVLILGGSVYFAFLRKNAA